MRAEVAPAREIPSLGPIVKLHAFGSAAAQQARGRPEGRGRPAQRANPRAFAVAPRDRTPPLAHADVQWSSLHQRHSQVTQRRGDKRAIRQAEGVHPRTAGDLECQRGHDDSARQDGAAGHAAEERVGDVEARDQRRRANRPRGRCPPRWLAVVAEKGRAREQAWEARQAPADYTGGSGRGPRVRAWSACASSNETASSRPPTSITARRCPSPTSITSAAASISPI